MKSTQLALSLVLVLAACGGDPPADSPDTGVANDAAVVGDTGPAVDSGPRPDVGPVDGGSRTDTGTVADTGTAADTGPTPIDSGPAVDAFVDPCMAHTFVVTVVGSAYLFDGGAPNATLTLCAGTTYMFDMSAVSSIHPMELRRGATLSAAIPAGITTSYTVPGARGMQPDSYVCSIHLFGGAVVVP